MKKPIIFVIDDDKQVLQAIARDLRVQYNKDFRILSTNSATEALSYLKELKNKNETVAVFISDQRMPEMLGVEFLVKARNFYPDAKRVLLTAYSDTDAAIKAINEVKLDYYLMKPWDPPEQQLYPVLDELIWDWKNNFVPPYEGIRVLGYQYSPKTHKLKDFLARSLIPYKTIDAETDPQAESLMESHNIEVKDLPAVFYQDGAIQKDPDLKAVAQKIGQAVKASDNYYDVVIIGAGPAGLAAAVYGASEGLKTLLIEKNAPGGQAGTSSRIENYLGFPNGLTGSDLTRRALTQALKFGTEFLAPQEAVDIKIKEQYKILKLSDGSEVSTKSIIITTGVEYRQLEAKGTGDFTGAGIYYGAAMTEALACKDKDVFIVGGGNSAGQGAVYLSQKARKVNILIRQADLKQSMSAYLIDQIAQIENIELIPYTEVAEARGKSRLEELVLRNIKTKEEKTVKASALFIFIGARPFTDWLSINIFKDEKGYLETGRELMRHKEYNQVWKLPREPYLLETCTPGIFAAGDVRSGAMARVASAVGEGSMAIKFVHEYLAEN